MTLILKTHSFEAHFEPERGGLLSELHWHNGASQFQLLFKPDLSIAGPVHGGMWVMVPFANRAFRGELVDGDTKWPLPINEPARGCCLHGFGWENQWKVIKQTEDRLCLQHSRTSGIDPYRYVAELEFAATGDRFHASLTVTNTAQQTLPYGIGFHPWFPCRSDTQLTLNSKGYVAQDAAFLPLRQVTTPDGGPYVNGAAVASKVEMHWSLIDWTGPALLRTPSLGLEIEVAASDSLRHPYVFSAGSVAHVCLEPQSHVVGAPSEWLANAMTPMIRLAPGESFSGWITLLPRQIVFA